MSIFTIDIKNITLKTIITGAGGFLGKLIIKEISNRGYNSVAINRDLLYGSKETLSSAIAGTNALINLAGAPILQRWTKKNKNVIYNSRVITVKNIVKAIRMVPEELRPKKIISASAIGIYRNNRLHDENSTDFEPGFLGNLVSSWESAWKELPENVNLTIFRIAVVLGREAVTVKKLVLPFRLGIGGTIGTGRQPFPFIHEKDASEAFMMALEDRLPPGIYNLTAPNQITNLDFTKALSKQMRMPAIFSIPAFVLKAFYGEAAGLLTKSPAVIPSKLTEAGFEFKYPAIDDVLKNII